MALRRYYIQTSDVSGATEAQVALADELIDRYVGPQPKFLRSQYNGKISSLLNSFKTIVDDGVASGTTQLDRTNGLYQGAILEVVSGAAAGLRGVIESSNKEAKSITLRAALSTAPAVGDYFKIYQLAKFPRVQDSYGTPDGLNYYPTIPEAVREATVAQVEFIIAKGAAFFTGDNSDFQSESFLNYSYSRKSDSGGGASSLSKLISPQARVLLRGIVNRTGRIVEGPGYGRREFI